VNICSDELQVKMASEASDDRGVDLLALVMRPNPVDVGNGGCIVSGHLRNLGQIYGQGRGRWLLEWQPGFWC